jgi:hypothetical protein
MEEGRGSQFDADLYDTWTEVVSEMLKADPQRAPAPTGEHRMLSLSEMVPHSHEEQQREKERLIQAHGADYHVERIWADERRTQERFPMNRLVRVRFRRLGKSLPVALKEWINVQAVDISRGGMQIHTDWPLSRGDLIEIELPVQAAFKPVRLARVVRVNSAEAGAWAAGLQFLSGA